MSREEIFHSEDYRIFDRLAKSGRPGPKGWVKVFLDNQLVTQGNNLVVAQGREYVAQKIFGTYSTETGTRNNYTNHKISHFAVGSGGATVEDGSVTLLGPEVGDLGLYESIGLGNTEYLNEPANNEDDTESPLIHTYQDAVKPITTDGQLFLEPVSYEGTSDWYTRVKCECVIPSGEPTQLESGDSVQISEAGMYFVNSTDVRMFGHICFSPKFKEKESELAIHWYILC